MQQYVPCYVYFRSHRGWEQNNTAATSLFAAAFQALSWFRDWYGPKPKMNTVLKIHAGWAGGQKTYYVRARRVLEHYGFDPREWLED